MSVETSNISPVTEPKTSRSTIVWAVFSLFVAFYAFLVWDAAYHIQPENFDPRHMELLDQIEAKSNQGVPYSEVAEDAREAYAIWNNLTAMVTGTYFGFGSNGNTDPVRYYASMEPVEKRVLSVHMLLGGVCIVLGIFQFWPQFRRKYRKAHRAVGSAYILACYTMVFASIYHMLHTGVENTYQGFTFHIQLWFLALSTLITQTLAIIFLKKKNYALHMGFQLYTFTAFLNAPVQRYDWAVMGWIYPHLTQGEVNNLVNLMTFWQCFILAWIIFAWNRAAAPKRSGPVEFAKQGPGFKVFITTLSVIALLTTVAFYLIWPGLSQWTVANTIVPATTLAADAALFEGRVFQNLIFTAAICTALVSGVWLMIRNEHARLLRRVFYVSAIIAGLIQLSWAVQLGEPKLAVTSGGGFYAISGVSIIGFALIAAFFEARGNENMWHETMVFAVNFAFTPALLFWGHALWYALDVIPQQYLDIGHGYILAAGAGLLTPMFNGYIGLLTSRETMSRHIR